MYNIQAQQGKGQWVTITQHTEQSEATRMAKLLSIENNNPHRVVDVNEETNIETPIIAFDWGKPFIEANGVDTFVPSYYDSLTNVSDEDDTPLVFYAIESRLNPVLNELRYTAWTRHNTRRFVDYEEAEASANSLSVEHPELDFRIVYADLNTIPSLVFRGGVKYAQLGDAPVAPTEKGD